MREQQQRPGEPLLAGVEELVHQVLFDPDVARQQVRDERLRELRLAVEQSDHALLADADQAGRRDRARGGHTERLGRQTAFAEEAASFQDADDGLLASRGDDRELDLAALDEEHGIGRVPLGEDDLLVSIRTGRLSVLDLRQECRSIEGDRRAASPYASLLWPGLVAEADVRLPASGQHTH
jgi:hypothetical protein